MIILKYYTVAILGKKKFDWIIFQRYFAILYNVYPITNRTYYDILNWYRL